MAESGTKVNVGQEVRMIDIPAESVGSMGVFKNIHGFASSAAFSIKLSEHSERYFGSPIDDFLTKITADSTKLDTLTNDQAEFIDGLKLIEALNKLTDPLGIDVLRLILGLVTLIEGLKLMLAD